MLDFLGGYCPAPPSPGPRTCFVMTKFGNICITHIVLFIIPSEFQVIISGSKEQQQGFLSKRGAILSQTWSDTLKTKGATQAVYNKFDMKIILMPL